MTLDINRVVNVDITTQAAGLGTASFGKLNIVTPFDNSFTFTERIRDYSSIDDVAADFKTTTEAYKAASVFFSQTPKPSNLAISFIGDENNAYIYSSGTTQANLDILNLGTNQGGEISLKEDGISKTVPFYYDGALVVGDKELIDHLNTVCSALDTEFFNAGIELTASVFVTESGTHGIKLTNYGTHLYTDISIINESAYVTEYAGELLGMGPLTGTSEWTTIEGVQEALSAIEDIDSTWYGLSFTKEYRDSVLDPVTSDKAVIEAAKWCEARTKIFANNTSDTGTLSSINTSNISYLLTQGIYSRTFSVFSSIDDYPAIALFGTGAAVDFNAEDTTITYKFQKMNGITPSSLTTSQANSLDTFRCNYSTRYGSRLSGESVSFAAEGVTHGDGVFIDEIVCRDWLENYIQTNVFNVLYANGRKVPGTNEGLETLVNAVELSLDQAVVNGYGASGFITVDGEEVFIPKGYVVFYKTVEQQTLAEKAGRQSPPIQFILNGAGAFHSATIIGQVNR